MNKIKYYISLKEFKKAPTSFTEEEVEHMCKYQKLSFSFMRKMKDYLNWHVIIYNNKIFLTEDFIKEMQDYVIWDHLSWKYGRMWSLNFIREFADKINWNSLIQSSPKLPEDFVIEMQKYIPFDTLLMYQMNYYSETFLRTIFKIAPWAFTDGFRTNIFSFSKDFLREIQDVVNPNLFLNNKLCNWDVMKEYKKYLNRHSWYAVFKDMDNIDINLILRYKENIYFHDEYFIQWVYKFEETELDKISKLQDYFAWCKKQGQVKGN